MTRTQILFFFLATLLAAGTLSAQTSHNGFDTASQIPAELRLQKNAAAAIVSATVETAPVPHAGDAADDPAIWIHPTDVNLSTILGTDKDGGLAVYDLAGNQLQFVAGFAPNNVDLRYNFPLSGGYVAVAAASNRSNNAIALYQVNPATRLLEDAAARTILTGMPVYGLGMYHSPVSAKYYVFVSSSAGVMQQWELFDNAAGKIDAIKVREFSVGSIVEGCVADDELGNLFVSEEDVALWKYGAEPSAGTARTAIDVAGAGGHLVPDIEGAAIYYKSEGTGYLIVSNQTQNEYALYRREGDHEFLTTFALGAGATIDGVTFTDGIDVTNFPLGNAFPFGAFVAQDDVNDGANQNFKLVPWESIANAFTPALSIDTNRDPRQVGAPVLCEVAADFSGAPLSGCAPLAMNFVDASTGPVISWLWDFGDGNTSAAQHPTHTYNASGTYTVKLTVGSGTCTNTKTKTGYVIVSDVPAAAFTATPLSGSAPVTVNFTDQTSGTPNAWSWNFGDGGVSDAQHPSHQYTAPGAYTVTLTCSNACGRDVETTVSYVTVNACAPSNVARNKTATASSTYSAAYSAAKAVDGSTSTRWRSVNLTTGNQTQWLEVNLGATHTIDKAVINWNGSYYAKDYQAQYWNGGAWLNLASVANATSGVKTHTFTPVTAQRFRLLMTRRNSSSYRVNEFELHGCAASFSAGMNSAPPAKSGTEIPEAFALEQNYPNPFNPATTIGFMLREASAVSLSIYDLRGGLVKRLAEGRMSAGHYRFRWDATNERGERVASGVYLCVLQAGVYSAQRKLVLLQ